MADLAKARHGDVSGAWKVVGEYGKAKKKQLSKEEKQDLVREVRENIEECYLFERDNRREAALDLQFLAGDQWPAAVKQARGTTRPMLTINQLPQFVRQVTNPTRQADIAIKVSPVDDTSDPELAKITTGSSSRSSISPPPRASTSPATSTRAVAASAGGRSSPSTSMMRCSIRKSGSRK